MPTQSQSPGGVVRRRSHLWMLLSAIGPGLIAAAAGNEAGGVLTYSQIGASHGYGMLWLLVLTTVSLVVAQEMGTRMGLVTGKGLADLIREQFGVRVAVFAMVILLIANLFTTLSEFAGIAASLELLIPVPGIRYVAVPLLGILLWLLVLRGSYRRVEKIFLALCAVYLVYVVAAVMAKPDWGLVTRSILTVHIPHGDQQYVSHAIALIGTTIAPWMQFYVQSTVRDKGLTKEHYVYEKWDVFIGSIASNAISFFIVVACAATLWVAGNRNITSVRDAAEALKPVASSSSYVLFAIGLFNASAVGAVIVPLSTAYAVTEAIGSESGLGRKIREAPLFIGVFTTLIVFAVVVTLLVPENRLLGVITGAQILNGLLLPTILVLMLLLINRRSVMGDYVNKFGTNLVALITIAAVAILSIMSVIYTFI